MNTQFDCVFTKAENEISAEIISPKTVKGFILAKNDSQITLTYNGIGISAQSDKLPTSVCSNLFVFFSTADGFEAEINEDGIYLSKNIGGIQIYTVFDKLTFVPLSTFDKDKSFFVTYSNYQLI